MNIRNIFEKDVLRSINGVIKVNDESATAVWQELDEYVVTSELNRHFRRFFGAYLEAVENPRNKDVRNRIGVWVSGFFGSGKSHFIKIISHLLHNKPVLNIETGESKLPFQFFENKIHDPAFLGEISRVAKISTDVLLFNIDSKAGNTDGRDAILRVFMRVLNELQGFSAEHPHLAEIELHLESEGKYEIFQQAFERIFGKPWKKERHAYRFRRRETVQALTEATGMSVEAAEKLLDETRTDYNLTVESFARRVKEYLDHRGKDHRIIFVADEVGQFIGTDTHLMLNLQTIVENLGTFCEGRAWVVVTSQEEMDSVLGNVVGAKSNDFSKIQGRFPTRLSLSSSNTDEVIQARLLQKTPEAEETLNEIFKEKGDVLRNQLSFTGGATLKNFKDSEDFTRNYPFAPYHYQLVQSVFESIRKAGATGLHLARGERSMLDAFQMGVSSIAEREVGKLVPFYSFYPSVESFLDTSVAKTINQAGANEGLEPFDSELLRVLFLIRYVDLIKPNVENLVTLCITEVDDDRLALKQRIEASLTRLEKETLISRNGDLFYFLTNEERDISREIKGVDVSADETFRQLSEFLFNEVLGEAAKYTYPVNKKVFTFNRLADGRSYLGTNLENNLTLEVITPLNDDLEAYTVQKCILASTERILMKLGDHKSLSSELREYLQTKRYIQQKSDASAPENTQRILRDKSAENQQRYQRIIEICRQLVDEADVFVTGQQLSIGNKVSLVEAQNYLVKNLFTKLGYIDAPATDPIEEIKAVLIADLVGQQSLKLDTGQPNANAIEEIRSYIKLRTDNDLRMTLEELTQQFAKQPYGWREQDTALLIAKLFAAGEIAVKIEAGMVEPRDAVESFVKPGRWKLVQIVKREVTDPAALGKARNLAHEVFGKLSPETKEDEIAKFIRGLITEWHGNLRIWRERAESGDYPGKELVKSVLDLVNAQNNIAASYEFFRSFNEKREDWLDASDDYAKLSDFHTNQIEIWRRLRFKLRGSFKDNRSLLDLNAEAKAALLRMEEIQNAAEPYAMIREIDGLIAVVDQANNQIISQRRENAVQAIDAKIEQLKRELDSINADADTRNAILYPFQATKDAIAAQESIQHIAFQMGEHTDTLFQNALDTIDLKRIKPIDPVDPAPPQKSTRTVKPGQLAPKPFIDDENDMNEYLNKLREEIERHLNENARVRIQ